MEGGPQKGTESQEERYSEGCGIWERLGDLPGGLEFRKRD